jgi:hypothetical protein
MGEKLSVLRSSIALLVMSITGPASAQAGYLCTADAATGFDYNERTKDWEVKRVKVDSPYVLKKKGDTWFIGMIGQSFELPCEKADHSNAIVCKAGFDLWMNTETLRFQSQSAIVSTIIPIRPGKLPDSVFIPIGRCAPL